MSNGYRNLLLALVSIALLSVAAFAQDTEKQVVVHPDGSYTVIEYPVNKELVVNLLPVAGITGSRASARVVRRDDGTKIYFDINGAPSDWSNVYAYAIDSSGIPTLLGPIGFSSGVGKAEFTTPMRDFMLVLSPAEGMVSYDSSTAYVYRSEIPQGYVVVPRKLRGDTKAAAVESSIISNYEVPLLNVPNFSGKTKEVKIKFTGDLTGLEGKAYIERKKGVSKVRMHFDDMKKVPAGKRFILWASSPDGQFSKLGQVVNSGRREEAEINSETSLADFGLFITVEDADVTIPRSRIYSVFAVEPAP